MALSISGILTTQILPPLLFVHIALVAGLLAWRGRRTAGLLVALCSLGLLFLATPLGAGLLNAALQSREQRNTSQTPQAIIVLGGEMAHGTQGPDVGPLTLERIRAAAQLHRRTGLPLLVTGGSLSPGAPPIALMMAASLQADFNVTVRWVEPRARDTRENAAFSAAMLRAEGIDAALLVTHAWHMPRAVAAFDRQPFPVMAAPVRMAGWPSGTLSDWVPRPDHLAQSWFMLREWAGLLVYRLRDGP